MICPAYIDALNLQCLLVNTFTGTGSFIIFGILAILIIAMVGGRFRLPNFAIGMIAVVFGIMFYDQMPWFSLASTMFLLITVGIIIKTVISRN